MADCPFARVHLCKMALRMPSDGTISCTAHSMKVTLKLPSDEFFNYFISTYELEYICPFPPPIEFYPFFLHVFVDVGY